MNHKITLIALVGMIVLLGACAQRPAEGVFRDTNRPISSMAQFDAERFAGLWYHVARFPRPDNSGCQALTSEFLLTGNESFTLENRCQGGGVQSLSGTAEIAGPGRFDVDLLGFPDEIWILWIDWDYRTAVIGMPSGEAGWILNRDPEIPTDRLAAAQNLLEFNGYDISRLEYVTP